MREKTMDAIERRQRIINILCIRHHETTRNLADEFGVSVKTMARDIDELSNHYPIYTVSGGAGGVFIVDGYRSGMKFLTQQQESDIRKMMETSGADERAALQSILDNFSITELKNRKNKKYSPT